MGFGFNLIGFPLLLLATGGLVIYAIAKQTWKPLLIVAAIWGLTILLFITATIADYFRTPISLTKADIIGEYRVDTNFFSGTNAKWQYDHYRFKITSSDSIIFYVTNKDTVIKTFKEKILYSSGPPDLWKVQSDTTYHILKYPPTLYRGYKKFYYVFKSDIYGNMFFRKVKK
ncbi:hypothetical protein [Paracnuella aquatica]|uniref:hypothetical protein n=1 Tax=Paracnuella aquatica TaxID=2268757 RepID=UPI000DEECA44|nr:hypothetical protein [Paracnuella aquatica]RPD43382.1 hypothetical protein DRJ53_20425 [Paracnuella aquatica]